MSVPAKPRKVEPAAAFAVFAAALTLVRLAGLFISHADLGPDEAQYWYWSTAPAFGYFSKPPLIAWTIAATTAMFGDGEWAVRFAAPLYHAGAALFVFLATRALYGPLIAFWTGTAWLILPGVSLSAALMTTDAPLLFFWSAALYFFVRLARDDRGGHRSLRTSAALGASIGLGLLSKYAMIYFPIAIALSLVLSAPLRRRVAPIELAIAAIVAGALIAPNAAWNAANDFSTLAHTAANANLAAPGFRPLELLEFWSAQLGVFGPVLLGFLIWALAAKQAWKAPGNQLEFALLVMAATPLVVVSIGAFLSRAHGNWAATAYPSALILTAAYLWRYGHGRLFKINAAFHLAIAFLFVAIFADFRLADRMGLSGAVKPLRGWAEQIAEVRLESASLQSIVVDDREIMAEILYYARGGPPVFALNANRKVDHHFEAISPYQPDSADNVLLVDRQPEGALAREFFGAVNRRTVVVGYRTLYLYDAAEPRMPE